MYTIDTLREHIEQKDKITKGERAEFLYPSARYSWDTALPEGWVNHVARLGLRADEIIPHFVWGYGTGTIEGQPLPLTLRGCEILRSAASPII